MSISRFEAWIGNCHLRQIEGEEEYQCQAAVWADSADTFRARLGQHIESGGLTILWLEECHPVSQYLQRHGNTHKIGALARAVHQGHHVELSRLAAVGKAGELEPENYLTITEHEFEPLPDQKGIPFWDQEWIASDLKALLFGQPEDGPRLRTYFIVDAALRKSVTGVFDLDGDMVDVPVQCLFKGDAAQDLKEVAPHLIDMTLPEGAWDDRDLVPSFHKDLFEKHWGKNSGVFIRTPALMAEVWRHFRKFTKTAVQEDGNWVFFLFHDPRVLPGYLRNIAQDAGKVRCFCTSDPGTDYCFLIETGVNSLFEVRPELVKLAEIKRPPFVLSYADFMYQSELEKKERIKRTAERLKNDFKYELKDQSLDDITACALKITERFKGYGFTKQEYIHLFVAWSVFFGEGFEGKDPQGLLKDICQSKASEDERFIQFKSRFETFALRPAEAG